MNIIQRINALRAQKAALLTQAETEQDADKLSSIRQEMQSINNQITDLEAIRDEMAGNAKPAAPQASATRVERTLGEVLQQAAAREFQNRGNRIRGVDVMNTASGQNEDGSSGADGGHLLSPTITTALLNSVREESFFLPKVRKLTVGMDSNSVEMPYVADKNRKDSVYTTGSEAYNRYGGTVAYWMGEADAYTPSLMKFGTRSLKLSKLGALGYATEEMLRDSRYLESIMRDAFRNAMTWEIDEAIMFGPGAVSGAAAKPIGMLFTNTGSVDKNHALVEVAKETGQAAATVNVKNILNMWNRMHPKNRSKAVWLINPDIELQLIQMVMSTGSVASTGENAVEEIVGTSGMPIYMPANGLSAAPYGTLLGRPVIPNEHMAAVGTAGDIAFVDPSEYFWIDRDGMTEATSVHVRFAYDEMAFKFTYRCNGLPTWYAAETPAKGTTTRSPYVRLATRA